MEVVFSIKLQHALGNQAQQTGLMMTAVVTISDATRPLSPYARFTSREALGVVMHTKQHLSQGDGGRPLPRTILIVIKPHSGFPHDFGDGVSGAQARTNSGAALDDTEARKGGKGWQERLHLKRLETDLADASEFVDQLVERRIGRHFSHDYRVPADCHRTS
jgi:hypothetical protein